ADEGLALGLIKQGVDPFWLATHAHRARQVSRRSPAARETSGSGRSSGPDLLGRLTPLTFSGTCLRVCSKIREFSAASGLSRASTCRSAAFGCGGSIPSLPTFVGVRAIQRRNTRKPSL